MQESYPLVPIARIHTDFPEKFGIPRQSGLVPDLEATILFEPPFRNPDALRGLEHGLVDFFQRGFEALACARTKTRSSPEARQAI